MHQRRAKFLDNTWFLLVNARLLKDALIYYSFTQGHIRLLGTTCICWTGMYDTYLCYFHYLQCIANNVEFSMILFLLMILVLYLLKCT